MPCSSSHPLRVARRLAMLMVLATCTFSARAQQAVPATSVLGGRMALSITIPGTDGTGNDDGWRMMAAPVAGATRADLEDNVNFTVGSGALVYTWDGTGWVAAGTGTALPNGQGFVLYLFDDATDPVTSSGKVIDVPGTAPATDVTVSGLPLSARYILLGNPFDQAVDPSGLGLTAAGFQQTMQIWNPTTKTYTLVTEAAGAGDVIAAWQGFFVERTTTGAGATALTFPAASRQGHAGAFVGKTGEAAAAARLGLELVAYGRDGREQARDAAVALYFDQDAHDGWDAYDASKLASLDQTRYALLQIQAERGGDRVALAQASRAFPLRQPQVFELALQTKGLDGPAELRWPRWEGLPAEWEILLEDTETGRRIDLREASSYRFTVSSPAAKTAGGGLLGRVQGAPGGPVVLPAASVQAAARFRLHVSPAAGLTPHEVPEALQLEAPYPNPAATETHVRLHLPDAGTVRLALFDVRGRQVQALAETTVEAGVHTLRVPVDTLAPGLYLLRLQAPGHTEVRPLMVVR